MSTIIGSFGNLKSDAGLAKLDAHMYTHSYIEGFEPSSADAKVVASMIGMPNASKFPNAARWYTHITAFSEAERHAWAGICPGKGKGKAAAPAIAAKKVDDDLDLFGSGDEAEEVDLAAAVAKKKAEKAKAEKAEKKEKKKEVAKSQLFWDIRPRVGEDINNITNEIKKISMDGLIWGEKVVTEPLAYGLMSVKMTCIIEDEKIRTDDVERSLLCVGLSEKMAKDRCDAWDQGLDYDEEDECPVTSVQLASMSKV